MEPAPAWQGKLAKVEGFTQRVPTDGAPISQRTEVYLGYDDKNLYAIFVCFDNEPRKIRARLSRREDVFDDDSSRSCSTPSMTTVAPTLSFQQPPGGAIGCPVDRGTGFRLVVRYGLELGRKSDR